MECIEVFIGSRLGYTASASDACAVFVVEMSLNFKWHTLAFEDDTKNQTKQNMLSWLVSCCSSQLNCVTAEFVESIFCLASI